MKARNKQTGELCEVYWQMCDIGRMCQASDEPIEVAPCIIYNAVVDDYEFLVNGEWIEGLEYIQAPYRYDKKSTTTQKVAKAHKTGIRARFLRFLGLWHGSKND